MGEPRDSGMVDPRIFEDLQTKIDEDAQVREQIRTILQTLERQGRVAQSILSRAHSTPASQCNRTSIIYQTQLKPLQFSQSSLQPKPPSKMK